MEFSVQGTASLWPLLSFCSCSSTGGCKGDRWNRCHRSMFTTTPPHPASQHTREAQDFTGRTDALGLLPMVHLALSPATCRTHLSGCITLPYDLFQVGCMHWMSNPNTSEHIFWGLRAHLANVSNRVHSTLTTTLSNLSSITKLPFDLMISLIAFFSSRRESHLSVYDALMTPMFRRKQPLLDTEGSSSRVYLGFLVLSVKCLAPGFVVLFLPPLPEPHF